MVVFLLDDVGWMDVGFNGGGVAVGNPTPDIDAVASGADFNFGVFSTEFFPNPRHDSHRTILHPPRHSDAANVQATGRSARVNHAATVAARSGLRHPGYREMAYGENKESQPQNVGFDDFRGFNSVSDMYTEWRDVHVNPKSP